MRRALYSVVLAILAVVLGSLTVGLLLSTSGFDGGRLYLLSFLVPVMSLTAFAAFCGIWLGGIVDSAFKRRPLSRKEDRRLSSAFVLALVSMSIILSLL